MKLAGGRWSRRIRCGATVSLGLLVGVGITGSVANWLAVRQGFSRHPAPGTLVDVGGHSLHLHCTGDPGGPTVVFESALGGWSIDWAPVRELLPRSVRACAYDRAGYGWSEASGRRVTPAEVADELAVLLERSGEPGPFLLVGHSLGGIYARQFAHRYPDQVAGMVLVDSTHEETLRRFPPDSEVVRSTNQLGLLRAARYLTITGVPRLVRMPVASHPDLPPEQQTVASAIGYRYESYHAFYNEGVAFTTASNDTAFTTPELPDVPAVVLASRENLDHPDTGSIARQLQRELATALPGADLEVVDAGHFIHTQRPQTVADAINDVLERWRRSAPAQSP